MSNQLSSTQYSNRAHLYNRAINLVTHCKVIANASAMNASNSLHDVNVAARRIENVRQARIHASQPQTTLYSKVMTHTIMLYTTEYFAYV